MTKPPSTESKITLPKTPVLIGWAVLIGVIFWSYICILGALTPGHESVFALVGSAAAGFT